jgi:hypothetical protein
MVRFESALERDCIAFLAGHDGFHRIESQPISISFTYGGRERRYTPDFLAIFGKLPDVVAHLGFGFETYIEVKYADEAAADRDILAARLGALSRQTGVPAVLLDEAVIRADRRR